MHTLDRITKSIQSAKAQNVQNHSFKTSEAFQNHVMYITERNMIVFFESFTYINIIFFYPFGIILRHKRQKKCFDHKINLNATVSF